MSNPAKKTNAMRIFSAIMAIIGTVILVNAIYPIASYQVMSKDKYPLLLSPIIEKNSSLERFDYTKASNWFVGGVDKDGFETTKVAFYTISIPSLKIEDATVAIGGDDLSNHLIQYPGTALPGKKGNSVIFGHSILPQFYNPKSYISIFSLLPTLNEGDKIKIYFDGIEFVYQVEDLFEVLPTDIQVLEQNISDSFVTLVTCTPPGDPRKPKRLIVRARLIPNFQTYKNENTRS